MKALAASVVYLSCFLPAQVGMMKAPAVPKGIPARDSAAKYERHASFSNGGSIGAEYTVRSFGGGDGGMFDARDHLTVEVAIYPGVETLVAQSHFTLMVNGKKNVLTARPPQFVAAALKYDDWGRRFPGDNRGQMPGPPRAPETEEQENYNRQISDRPTAYETAIEKSLPEGKFSQPVSGFLFFAYNGKTKSIKSVELVYNGPGGVVPLKFF